MSTSWKTTSFGLAAAIGAGIIGAYTLKPELLAAFPKWLPGLGVLLSSIGTAALGLAARDNNKTSEDVGAGASDAAPPAPPAAPRSGVPGPVLLLLALISIAGVVQVARAGLSLPARIPVKLPSQSPNEQFNDLKVNTLTIYSNLQFNAGTNITLTTLRAGQQIISAGFTETNVTFSVAMPSSSFAVVCSPAASIPSTNLIWTTDNYATNGFRLRILSGNTNYPSNFQWIAQRYQ